MAVGVRTDRVAKRFRLLKDTDRQAATHRGVGSHPLPRIPERIVDCVPVSPRQEGEGVLLVRDPKVMQGYVNGAELMRQVLVDG
jgi:long-subunit acyl-CoA synthetase (AMP-forming)